MTEIIKGINTAAITHEGKLLAVALKIRNAQHQESLYYMQNVVIRDMMIIMHNKLRAVAEKIKHEDDAYKTVLVAENQALIQQIPQMCQEDITNPDSARRIMSVALKHDAETFSIIAALQNGQIAVIRFSITQAEFVLHAMTQAMQNSGDKESVMHLCGSMDYIPLYDTGFKNVSEMDYQQYHHDVWRQDLFPNYVAILFKYQTPEGKKILRGAVIKTYLTANTAEIQSIAGRIALLMPQYKALQEKHQLTQVFCRDIDAPSNSSLTTEQCLRPLRDFYLEMASE